LAPAPPPTIELVPSHQLTADQRRAIIVLCQACFDEDLATFFESLGGSSHVLVWTERLLVAHACWMERWLQPAGLPLLHTAYVEAVAVVPGSQRQGWGTLAMQRIGEAIAGYDLGGLATGSPSFYVRLGWEQWRGPTAIRMADGLLPTPDEHPMILRTARTPPLDLDALLTAEWRIGELW
jgi:aminoglycoside 2'-N-acetyltransferase I